MYFQASTLVVALAAAGLTAAAPVKRAAALPNFNQVAVSKGKLWFGSEIGTDTAETSNTAYMTIFNNHNTFGQTTPGNSMKFEFVEPEQNTFTFASGQETITLAKESNKQVRCHNLIWSAELPSWVTSPSAPWTVETLSAVMENHITKTIHNYGDSCHSWDVVNEALAESGSGYASNPFYDTIGADYVALAFKYAAAAVKSANLKVRLFYNDYGIESPGNKNSAAVAMIQSIKSQGIKIDGVGFESHFSTSYYPTSAEQQAAMKGFTAMGLNIHVTELDVSTGTADPSASELAEQASAYYATIDACMKIERCYGMTVWDFDDQYSWISSGASDLYTSSLTAKPAVTAVSEALAGKACSVCS